MSSLKIATLNIRGLKDPKRKQKLIKFIDENNIDILALQEVNVKSLEIHDRNLKSIVNYDGMSPGTALIYNTNLKIKKYKIESTGRIIRVEFENFTIVNVYGPQESLPTPNKNLFFDETLPKYLKSYNENLILLGDFNNTTHSIDREGPTRINGKFKRITEKLNLIDTFRNLNGDIRDYTFISRNGKTRIDRIYCERKLENEIIRCTHSNFPLSDHRPVILELKDNLNKEKAPVSDHWKMNVCKLNDKELDERIKTIIIDLNEDQDGPIKIKWENFKSKIKLECREYCKQKAKEERTLIKFYERCIDDLFQNPTSPDFFDNYTELKSILSKIRSGQFEAVKMRGKSNFPLVNEAADVGHLLRERTNNENRKILKIENDKKETLTDPKEITDFFEESYTELYKSELYNRDLRLKWLGQLKTKIDDDTNNELTDEIKRAELDSALSTCDPGSSPGPDGIPFDFYKKYWDLIGPSMLKLMNEIMTTKTTITSHKFGLIKLIPKKRSPCNVNDYRPISLLCTDYRIYAKIIANRLRDSLTNVISNAQTGGVKGRDIADNLAIIRNTIQYANDSQKKAAIISIDFQKAFDMVERSFLWESMEKYGYSTEFINILKGTYEQAYARIQINGKTGNKIYLERGIRQGCPLALYLYVIYINPLIEKFEQNLMGLKTPRVTYSLTAYVDDINVLTGEEEDFELVENSLMEFENITNAKINRTKTFVMGLGKIKHRTNWPVFWLTNSEELEILGIKWLKTIKKTIAANEKYYYHKIEGSLISAMERSLTIIQKVELVNIHILPKLTYISRVLPFSNKFYAQITSRVNNFIWRHRIEKLAIAELYNLKKDGGLKLAAIKSKCLSNFIKTTFKHWKSNGPNGKFIDFWVGKYLNDNEKEQVCSKNIPSFLSNQLETIKTLIKKKILVPGLIKTQDIYKYLLKDQIKIPKILIKNENSQGLLKTFNFLHRSKMVKHRTLEHCFFQLHNILTTKDRLLKCNQTKSEKCEYCDEKENLQHVFTCTKSNIPLQKLNEILLKIDENLNTTQINFVQIKCKIQDKYKKEFIQAVVAEFCYQLFRARKKEITFDQIENLLLKEIRKWKQRTNKQIIEIASKILE